MSYNTSKYERVKELTYDRLNIIYRPPNKNDDAHHLIINRASPKLSVDISTRPIGINVWMQGDGIQTLNDRPTQGKYPVKWTLPGELDDERIASIIYTTLNRTLDIYGDVKNNSDFQRRILKGLERILAHRGKMDERGEIPKEFFESASDNWLKRGLKHTRPEDGQERQTSGVNNWMLDIQTSIFFANAGDQRDRLKKEDFEKIFFDVAQNKILIKDAEREMRKQNQLQVHLDIKAGLKICFEKGILKEKIWGYKNWKQMMPYFEKFLVSGVTTSKKLSALLAADKNPNKEKLGNPIYLPVIAAHIEQITAWPALHPEKAVMRDKFLELLTHWPKTPEMAELLNTAFNYGIPMEMIVEKNITRRGPMEELIELAQKSRSRERSIIGLNQNYKEPEVDLQDKKLKLKGQWEFVNHKNIAHVGKYYKCCFSDSSYYETEIGKGVAIAFFLTDRSSYPEKIGEFSEIEETSKNWNGIGRGALCFATHNGLQWGENQIKAFANRNVHEQYTEEARKIIQKINEIHPQRYEEISREIGGKVVIDLVQEYIDKKQHWTQINQNIINMDFRPESIDKMLGISELRSLAFEENEEENEETAENQENNKQTLVGRR